MERLRVFERLQCVFQHTLIRANLTCGAEATLEVLRETSSLLWDSRAARSSGSPTFLTSKALIFWDGADIIKSVFIINDNIIKREIH